MSKILISAIDIRPDKIICLIAQELQIVNQGKILQLIGSGISRFLNLQNQKFGVISCSNCGYSEMYRLDGRGGLGTFFDILTN